MTTTTKPNTSTPDLTLRWKSWGENGLPFNARQRLAQTGTFSSSALGTFESYVEELEQLLEQRSPIGAVDAFLATSDAWGERVDRFATVRTLERLSQLKIPVLERPRWALPQANMRRRALTEVEIGTVRYCSLRNALHSASIGAFDAGVQSGELPGLFSRDVHLDANGAIRITVSGTERKVTCGYPVATPRTLDVPSWCQPAMTQLAKSVDATRPLLYGGRKNGHSAIQSAILMNISNVLKDAGLGSDPSVKPLSIRNTAGRRACEAGGLEAAARLLGHDDFSSVAREIGLRPHAPVRER
jgi:hypothetical protein